MVRTLARHRVPVWERRRIFGQPILASHTVGWDFSGVNSTVTVTGAGVSDVTDSSGNGNDGFQTTDANRGALTTINGIQAIDLEDGDGLNFPASLAGWPSPNNGDAPLQWLTILQVEAFDAGAGVLAFDSIHQLRGQATDELTYQISGSGSDTMSVTGLSTGVPYLVSILNDAAGNASFEIYSSAGLVGSDTATGLAAHDAVSSDGRLGLDSQQDYRFGEVHLFDAVLSSGGFDQWRTYLSGKWL